jgi:hypothetical protein
VVIKNACSRRYTPPGRVKHPRTLGLAYAIIKRRLVRSTCEEAEAGNVNGCSGRIRPGRFLKSEAVDFLTPIIIFYFGTSSFFFLFCMLFALV